MPNGPKRTLALVRTVPSAENALKRCDLILMVCVGLAGYKIGMGLERKQFKCTVLPIATDDNVMSGVGP